MSLPAGQSSSRSKPVVPPTFIHIPSTVPNADRGPSEKPIVTPLRVPHMSGQQSCYEQRRKSDGAHRRIDDAEVVLLDAHRKEAVSGTRTNRAHDRDGHLCHPVHRAEGGTVRGSRGYIYEDAAYAKHESAQGGIGGVFCDDIVSPYDKLNIMEITTCKPTAAQTRRHMP